MAYLNEVDATTVTDWLNNFNNCPNNIYTLFQDNAIDFTLPAYEALCANNLNHINIYFGMDENGNPKMIAVGSYLLDDFDGEETTGFADVLDPNKIYELYSDAVISKALAVQYANKWKTNNGNSSLFKKSFLLPRPNFIKLFIEDQADPVRIFFGMNDTHELKVMQKDPNGGTGTIVANSGYACPYDCPEDGLL